MFETIDRSNLASQKIKINYDVNDLEKDGFKLKFMLNPKNPIYDQVLNECKHKNVSYKIMPGDNNQKHIWIK
ncbi:MAG: hypothetical protein WC554_15260 [Clostridia bacterium]|jgi:hypothetical protein